MVNIKQHHQASNVLAIDFDVDIVNDDAQYVISLILRASNDENIIISPFEYIQTLYSFQKN